MATRAHARVPWYRKKLWWALIASPFVLFLLVFFAFDPLVERIARRQLATVKGYEITFEHAKLQPTRLNLGITRFKVMKLSAGGDKEPFMYMEKIQLGLLWRELLHFNLVARVDMDVLKLNLIAAKAKEDEQLSELPDLGKQLNDLMPLRIDRVGVRRGEMTYLDKTTPEAPRIWLHEMEVTVENVSTRAALARGEPTVVAVSAKLQKTGDVTAYITADPLAKGLWFSGQVKAVGIDMRDFHDLIASKSGLALEQGTLDLFAEFESRGEHISGGIRPILKNAQVKQVKSGVDNWVKKVLADAALDIFSDRVDGRNAVATTIPIEGKVTGPDIQLWPTILGVVRNAFVAGVTESFEKLPPPKAKDPESGIKQAVDALSTQEAAPKAQPGKEANK